MHCLAPNKHDGVIAHSNSFTVLSQSNSLFDGFLQNLKTYMYQYGLLYTTIIVLLLFSIHNIHEGSSVQQYTLIM